MGGEQNLGFGLVGVSIKPASPSLMRYFSSNISYYKDTSVTRWDDKKGYLDDRRGLLGCTHRPVIPARDAGIQESLLVSKQTNFVNIESS
jgi:hypothetical protein